MGEEEVLNLKLRFGVVIHWDFKAKEIDGSGWVDKENCESASAPHRIMGNV